MAPLRRDADGLEEVGLGCVRLAALDQLEQGDEGGRLGAALERRDLVVEDEAAAGAHEQAEALDEWAHGDGAAADRGRVDALGRLEQVQHRLGQAARLLVDERGLRPRRRIGRGRRAEDAQARVGAPLGEPGGRALEALVLGEPRGELLGGGLGVELLLVVLRLGVDEQARLELAQCGDQQDELGERLEVDVGGLVHAVEVRQDDGDDRHLDELELLAQHERQQEVERAREGVEVEVELENGSVHASIVATSPDGRAKSPVRALSARVDP